MKAAEYGHEVVLVFVLVSYRFKGVSRSACKGKITVVKIHFQAVNTMVLAILKTTGNEREKGVIFDFSVLCSTN
jgi:hypothetical protein